MISDSLDNAFLYVKNNPLFEMAFKFLNNNKKTTLIDGKHEIDGENIYALVQSYDSTDEDQLTWESHKKYIDIQYVQKGKEIIKWNKISNLTQSEPYNPNGDCILFKPDTEGSSIILEDNDFAIFFPDDAHKPRCKYVTSCAVKKIVLKIKI